MTTTTLPPRRRWSRERIASCIGALAVGVVGLVAIGRFVAPRDAGRSAPAALTAAPATLGEALTAAERRTVERPTDPAAWTALGSLAVRQAAATGDPAFYLTARSALDEARRLAPDSIDLLVADGGLALAVHDFTAAAELAETAVAAAPFTAEAYAVAVDAAVELGDYELAEARLQALLDLKPDAAALTRTSYLRELHGDLAGASAALRAAEEASRAEPAERAVVATFLGDLELLRGDPQAAAAAYDRALAAAPGLLLAELGTARLAVADGRLPDAVAALETLVARSPQPAVATLLADVQLLAGDRAAADAAFALVRANDRLLVANGVAVDLESAVFEADRGDATLAVEQATVAYGIRRTVFTADALGWALTRAGRATEALPYVEESLALGSVHPSVRLHAAAAHAAVGATDRARTELGIAVANAPWFSLSLLTTAAELASSVGVELPAAWRLP